jgi:hypothetical protein
LRSSPFSTGSREIPMRTLTLPSPAGRGWPRRRPGEGLGIRTTTATPTAWPLASVQNFTISRTDSAGRTIVRNGGKTCFPARPSPPLRNVSCSPGGRGTRRDDSAGALSPRGILARKWPATRPVFWKSPHRGPGEGTPKWPGRAKNPPDLPYRLGGIDIIEAGFVIVFKFRPDFFPRDQLQGASDLDCPSFPAAGVDP